VFTPIAASDNFATMLLASVFRMMKGQFPELGFTIPLGLVAFIIA